MAMAGGVNMKSNKRHIAHWRLGVRGLGVIVGCLALFGSVAITAAPAGASAAVLDTSGTSLTLGGVPQTFTGYVAYSSPKMLLAAGGGHSKPNWLSGCSVDSVISGGMESRTLGS